MPPPQPSSGLGGIFAALNPTPQRPRPQRPVPPPDTESDAVAGLLMDLAAAPTVNAALGVLQADLDQRMMPLAINLGAAPSAGFRSQLQNELSQQLTSKFGDANKAAFLAKQITDITFRKVDQNPDLMKKVGVPVTQVGKFLNNPRLYIDGSIQKILDEGKQGQKDLNNARIIAGGSGTYATLLMMMQTARSGVSFENYHTVVSSYKSESREKFRDTLDETINKTSDAQEKARLNQLKSQLDNAGLSKDTSTLSRAWSWYQFGKARSNDQMGAMKGVLNFGMPLSMILSGEMNGRALGGMAGSGAQGEGVFAGAAQMVGKNAFMDTYQYNVGGINGQQLTAVGVRNLSLDALRKDITDATTGYSKAMASGNTALANQYQAEINRLRNLERQSSLSLASDRDGVRIFDKGSAEIRDAAGNVVGYSYGKDFFYSFYTLHPKQWVDGLISGKQWVRLASLKNSRFALMQWVGSRAEDFMNGGVYQNTFARWYRFNNKWIRGNAIKVIEKLGQFLNKLVVKLQQFIIKTLETILKPLIKLIASMLAKIGFNAIAAALTAGGSLVVTLAYEGINFVTFGALDKVVMKGLKLMIDISVLAIMAVFGVILLCAGGIAVVGPQAMQNVGAPWLPVGGAQLVFGPPAGPVQQVGNFRCPFGDGGLRCTQGPYGCYSHAQCSNGLAGGGSCRSYEYSVDIGLNIGSQIVAPEAGHVSKAGDMACNISPRGSSIGGYIEFVGAQSGLTYKFFHVRGNVTGQVPAGSPIGVVSSPSGGQNGCWSGPHAHSSISGQNAEQFYTSQPSNACQFSCGTPNCTPTN